MVDKDKLCRMIALARFEKKNEDKALRINTSYEQDYIANAMIRNFIITTIAFVLVMVVIVMFRLDVLLSNLNNLNLRPLIAAVVLGYLIMLAFFSVISYTLAKLRYARAASGVEQYRYELEKLRKVYRAEDALRRRGGDDDDEEA